MFCSCTEKFPQEMLVHASLFEVASEYSIKVGLVESSAHYVSENVRSCFCKY